MSDIQSHRAENLKYLVGFAFSIFSLLNSPIGRFANHLLQTKNIFNSSIQSVSKTTGCFILSKKGPLFILPLKPIHFYFRQVVNWSDILSFGLYYFLQSAKAIENNNFSSDSMLTLLSTLFSLVKFKTYYDEIFQKVYGGRGHYRTFSKLRSKVNFQFKLLKQRYCVIRMR